MDLACDLVVIGAGSGGVALARRAASHGARVAVVEASRVGGTCVIRGCVPKKLLMYAAQYGDALREAPSYGWELPAAPRFDMARWAAAKAAETARLEGVYRTLLSTAGVQLVEGRARIVAPQRVEVDGRCLTAPQIVVATGGHPVRAALPGLETCPTSDDLLDLTALPPAAAILGGGYIACEFASMFARLGVEVSLLFRDRLPLRGFDEDLRTRVAAALADAGVHVRPGSAPRALERTGEGWRLVLPAGETLDAPWVLNALGRRPNTADLGLEALGIAIDATGAVPVNAELATVAPGVHAVGDVTNRKNLTPVAIAEGRWLADRLFGASVAPPVALDPIASAVFTLPPIGTLGPSEAQLALAGRPVAVYEADFKPMRHAFTGRAERIYMKLLADAETDRVLALHMIGADAPEIVQSLAVAVTAGATKADFDRTLAVHPTTAEEFVLLRTPSRHIGVSSPPVQRAMSAAPD
jgi:glutathione reductase (NADPH)